MDEVISHYPVIYFITDDGDIGVNESELYKGLGALINQNDKAAVCGGSRGECNRDNK